MSDYETLSEMPLEDFPYSIASHIAYEYYNNDFEPITTQDQLDSMIEGYTLDEEFSSDVGTTIIKPEGGAILAFRATDPTNPYDINADLQLATGIDRLLPLQTRLSRAEELYNSVKEQYGMVDLTGWSLGGYLSEFIARKNNEQSVAFNIGLSPLTSSILPPVRDHKPISYVTDNIDLISHSINNPLYANQVSIKNITQTEGLDAYLGSHSLDSFLPRERIVVEEEQREIKTIQEKILTKSEIKNMITERKEENIVNDICEQQPYLEMCPPNLSQKQSSQKEQL
jgi:predicted esterase YcpF (UPF0227 family)